jgi:hypothetical protein
MKAQLLIGKSRELRKVGATRFGTNTLVGQRLIELETPLQQTVVDPDYVAQKYKDLPDDHEITNCETVSRQHKGGAAKALVLDEGFWARVKAHVRATMPLCKFLRRHDTSAPSAGKVYHGWFEMGEHISSQPASAYKAHMVEKHMDRWNYGDCALYFAGYVLDPEFIDHKQQAHAEVMQGFHDTLEKLAILFEVRRLNAIDGRFERQWAKRCAAIEADPMAGRTWDDYPAYPTNATPEVKTFCTKCNAQLALYRGKKGVFAREWIMESAAEVPAYMWWDLNGASVPELQKVACMVLAQPASASICERINSEFAFVKDRRRNKLGHEKANKLVRIFHNLRLIHKMHKPKYTEPAVGWSHDVEKSGVEKFGVAHHEILVDNTHEPQQRLTHEPQQLHEPATTTTTRYINHYNPDGRMDGCTDVRMLS